MSATYWRAARADKASVIIDAEDYFRFARDAMLKARRRIMLIGWDFDARIALVRGDRLEQEDVEAPATIGDLIYWLVERNPDLEVYLLRWDLGAFTSLFRGKTIFTVAKWMMHPRIQVRLDKHHPPAASHHQKIVVIDDAFAFCGGIDMTADRWDTRAHSDEDAYRVRPGGTPAPPWHDATTALQGPVAAALGKHARDRWKRATGEQIEGLRGKHDCWPDDLPVQFTDVDVTISRTAPRMDDQREVTEIEALYLEQIARAKKWIYAESQYFASRRIAEAIARRLDEPDGPEIVIVTPESAWGWLEPLAMDTARARIVQALRQRDKHGRLKIYHPYTRDREAIYVHAKIFIVDDAILRVGSSNLNNRSLRLDTECDVAIDCAAQGNADCAKTIAAIRNDLIAEHTGTSVDKVEAALARSGSLIETIETLRFTGRRNARKRRRTLMPYKVPNLSSVEAWLADNQILDPEGPDEMFEAPDRRGLFRRFGLWRQGR